MLKVLKFGGSSLADAHQFAKVKSIVEADPARRVVIVSAPGKRFSGDHKITDLLYLCAAHIKYGVSCEDIFAMIRGRYDEIIAECGAVYVGYEEATLICSEFERLKNELSGCEFAHVSALLTELRRTKSEDEVKKMAAAQDIADAAFSHILGFINPSRTEAEVACELEYFMKKNGADGIAFETIAVSGKSSSSPHASPAQRLLEPGFLTMDYGATVEGYRSDMTRTVVLGHADEEMKRLYDTVLRALRDEAGYWWTTYRKAFKRNFKASILPGILYCVVVTVQIFLVYFCFNMLYHGTNVGVPMWVATVLNLVLFHMLFSYLWPQIVLLDQPLRLTLKNSLNCMIAFLPHALAAALVTILFWGLVILCMPLGLLLMLVFGFWFQCEICCQIVYGDLNRVFHIEESIQKLHDAQLEKELRAERSEDTPEE